MERFPTQESCFEFLEGIRFKEGKLSETSLVLLFFLNMPFKTISQL